MCRENKLIAKAFKAEKIYLLPTRSNEREVLGIGGIPLAIGYSLLICQCLHLMLHCKCKKIDI